MNLLNRLKPEQKILLFTDEIGDLKSELEAFIRISRISAGDALVTARRIIEFIVNGVLEREGFAHSHELIQNIETLGGRDPRCFTKRNGAESVLPPQIYSGLHSLRIYGNSVTHPFETGTTIRKTISVNQGDIDVALAQLLRIVEWFFIEYNKGPQITHLYSCNIDPALLNKYLKNKLFKQVVREYVSVDASEELCERDLIPDAYAVEYDLSDAYEDEESEDETEDEVVDEEDEWNNTEAPLPYKSDKTPRSGLLTSLRLEVPRMVILGPPGIGKSTTLRYLVHQDACKYIESTQHAKLPIYVELKNYIPGNTLESLINNSVPLGSTLRQMLDLGEIALYLDGLNEVIDLNQFNFLITEINRIIASYKNIDIFVTCRPKGYENYFSLPTFNIRPLSDNQIQEYLHKNYNSTQKGDDFFERLQKNSKLKRICENPFILRMMVSVVKAEGQIPENTGQLIRRFMKNLCEREKVDKNATFDPKSFGLLISNLAYKTRLAKQQVFSEVDALDHIEEQRSQLRTNGGGLPFLTLACDMNILEQTTDDHYTFVHELFQEYYAAEKLTELIQQNEKLICKIANDPHWGETIVLCAGLMKNRDKFITLLSENNSLRAAEYVTSSTVIENKIEEIIVKKANLSSIKNNHDQVNGLLALIELARVDDVLKHIHMITQVSVRNQLICKVIGKATSLQVISVIEGLNKSSNELSHIILSEITKRVEFDEGLDCANIYSIMHSNYIEYCPPILIARDQILKDDPVILFEKIIGLKQLHNVSNILNMYDHFDKIRSKYCIDDLVNVLIRLKAKTSTLAELAINYDLKNIDMVMDIFVKINMVKQKGKYNIAKQIAQKYNIEAIGADKVVIESINKNNPFGLISAAISIRAKPDIIKTELLIELINKLTSSDNSRTSELAGQLVLKVTIDDDETIIKTINKLIKYSSKNNAELVFRIATKYKLHNQISNESFVSVLVDSNYNEALAKSLNEFIACYQYDRKTFAENIFKVIFECNREKSALISANLALMVRVEVSDAELLLAILDKRQDKNSKAIVPKLYNKYVKYTNIYKNIIPKVKVSIFESAFNKIFNLFSPANSNNPESDNSSESIKNEKSTVINKLNCNSKIDKINVRPAIKGNSVSQDMHLLTLVDQTGKFCEFKSDKIHGLVLSKKSTLAKLINLSNDLQLYGKIITSPDPKSGEMKHFIADLKTIIPIEQVSIQNKQSVNISKKITRGGLGKSTKLQHDNAISDLQLIVPQVPFSISQDKIAIYIDEAWPSGVDPSIQGNIGVIAGIVWDGNEPDYKLLPKIKTHLRNSGSVQISHSLAHLLRCKKAFPFVIPFALSTKSTQTYYLAMVKAAIKIVLGWLLPNPQRKCTVSVYLEAIGSFDTSIEMTEHFNGMLEEAALTLPGRFTNWKFNHVSWNEKSYGYIPYADLIAYLAHEHHKGVVSIADAAHYHTWPGYLPLSLDLIPALGRLGVFETPADINSLLDFVSKTCGSKLCKVVVDDFYEQAGKRFALVEWLVESLERRYHVKSRSISNLRNLLIVFGPIIQSTNLPLRIDFIMSLVHLHQANLDGNPAKYREKVSAFLTKRHLLLEFDKELTAIADLNYVVHLNDQFNFEEALNWCENLHQEPWFPFLPPSLRGAAHSSLGQCLSITGKGNEAELAFSRAINEFDKQALIGTILNDEIDQTSVYRAINAIDYNHSESLNFVEKILGPFDLAIDRLACSNSLDHVYHHHLLLRTLWFNSEAIKYRDSYLKYESKWKTGDQHPWQLIEMYRGLLLFCQNKGTPDLSAVKHRFDRSLAVSVDGAHGATFRLIGSVIATIAACVGEHETWKSEFIEIAEKLGNESMNSLPNFSVIYNNLQKHLANPNGALINDTLRLLPFNYR